jgi:hypothetical protein
MRGLGDVARDYGGVRVSKEDPYRMRYGEIIGKRFADVQESGFWSTPPATRTPRPGPGPPLPPKALGVARRFAHGVSPDGDGRLARWLDFGVLTEQVQVKGAIALMAIERAGMPYSPEAAAADERGWRPVVEECVKALDGLRPDFFKKKNGAVRVRPQERGAQDQPARPGRRPGGGRGQGQGRPPGLPPAPVDRQEGPRDGGRDQPGGRRLGPVREVRPVPGPLGRLADATKRLGFYAQFQPPARDLFSALDGPRPPRIRSRYNPLMRTGPDLGPGPQRHPVPPRPGLPGDLPGPARPPARHL